MKFVKLTGRGGETVYVNMAHVASFHWRKDHTVLLYAVPETAVDEDTIAAGLAGEYVTETPEAIMALLGA